MKKTKFFAVVMAAVMTLSMVACGEKTNNEVTPTADPTATTAPTEAPANPTPTEAPSNVTIADASITFEDGNMGFVQAYMQHATSANLELSIADYNGSKALKVVNLNGKSPWIGIDVSSLLGANVANVAGVEMVVGTSHGDKFYATAGEIITWWGTELTETKLADWSVYMAKKNPKVVSATITAGCEYVADANNLLIINLRTDNGSSDGVAADIYIDDIRFYDAAGNTITADTTVAFNAPAAFEGGDGPDLSNIYTVSNAVEFAGFATSGGGWGQDGFEMPQEIIDALVPGSVVEIEFTSEDGTMWIVMPDAAAGWSRIGQGAAYINNSATVAQITYEQFVEVLGEDKTTWGARMQCEAQTAWEVYSVKVGTATPTLGIANAVEFEGFATSGSGWGQNGFEMPQEIIDALVPGSVVEIDYSSEDGTLWIVMPWAEAGWMRCAQGTAVLDGSKCYVTYEQIEAMCGPDKTTWGALMQCESQTAWEVYGLRVGTKIEYPVISGLTAFDGFATSGSGWGQNGAEMPQELVDALVPGSIIEISFTSEDNTMWIVMPWAEAGWSRCAQGTATIIDGKAYVTYEQIAAVCGEDKSTWGAMLQFESQTAWEVYGIRVGKYATTGAAAEGGEEVPAATAPDPTIQVADGDVAYTSSKTFADSLWWTQVDLSLADLLGGVDPATVTAIKFTCADTNFIVGYNDTISGGWAQYDTSNTYVVKTCNFDGTDPIVCLYLSKGDGVEYTISWEVYTGGSTDIIASEEPAAPAGPQMTYADGKGTLVASDSGWWTQLPLTLDELLAGVAAENVTGFKFTGDTDFIIAYNDAAPTWIQKDAASSFELTAADINLGGDYYFCFVLSKGDGVEYTLNWEVLTDGTAAGTTDTTKDDYAAQGGDWSAVKLEASALAGISGAAEITVAIRQVTDGYSWWQFCPINMIDPWTALTAAEDFAGTAPTFNDWGWADTAAGATTITFTLSADAVAKIVNGGSGLGIQCYGIVVDEITAKAVDAGETPSVDTPVAGGTAYDIKTTPGDWGGYTNCVPTSAFADCANGATVVVNFEQEVADYWNLTPLTSSWSALKDYVTNQTFNDWGFIDAFAQGDTSITLEFTADGVAKIVADGGGLMFQVYALNVTSATVIPQ